jgi:hypothetical protein
LVNTPATVAPSASFISSTSLRFGFLMPASAKPMSMPARASGRRRRAGGIDGHVFLISDYQNVGYANTMMRPPVEMYGAGAD